MEIAAGDGVLQGKTILGMDLWFGSICQKKNEGAASLPDSGTSDTYAQTAEGRRYVDAA